MTLKPPWDGLWLSFGIFKNPLTLALHRLKGKSKNFPYSMITSAISIQLKVVVIEDPIKV